jgi:hypothetical protein
MEIDRSIRQLSRHSCRLRERLFGRLDERVFWCVFAHVHLSALKNEPVNTETIQRIDAENVSIRLDLVADLGAPAELAEDEAADGVVEGFIQLHLESLVEFFDRE